MINIDLSAMVQGVIDGELNPLKLEIQIREIQARLKEAQEEINGAVWEELNKYHEKEVDFEGYVFGKRNGAVRYNYKDNPDWAALELQKKDLEQYLKTSYLAMMKGVQIASADGEEIVLPTPVNSKDSFSLKYKKS